MLTLGDLAHLPLLEPLVAEIVADGPGLVVVAGIDPRPVGTDGGDTAGGGSPGGSGGGGMFLPSGRATIWRLLFREIMEAHPGQHAVLVARDAGSLRVPRAWRRRLEVRHVASPAGYAEAIARAAGRGPGLLAVDELTADSAPAALEAARAGLRVFSQLDTVFYGAAVARHLLDLAGSRDLLDGLRWVVSVQRLPTLCPHCRAPGTPPADRLEAWCERYPGLAAHLRGGTYFVAAGCRHCHGTGRAGEITAFDVLQAGEGDATAQPSRLPLEAYVLGLAAGGHLAAGDVDRLEADHLRRTYNLLAASERALRGAKADLERRLAELEAANRVLQQRTEALVALEGIGQALITSEDLAELAGRLCRHARDLCGADRAILYYLPPQVERAEVLAVSGWDAALAGRPLAAGLLSDLVRGGDPRPYNRRPPGVPQSATDLLASTLQTGLAVPLAAHETPVGLMIVHSSRRARFGPGEVSLLQAFANQAALAIQRAGLFGSLRQKIAELEAAQVALLQKERMEHELELARELQQRVLPRIFPLVPCYAFAGRSRAARWVGGDFYDVIPLDAARFAVVAGDVSDKGMRAALYMAQTHSLLRAEARRSGSPAMVLRTVHRLLQELSQAEMFVTVFYGVVDGPERRLTYARAGHDLPLLVRGGVAHALGGDGMALGFPGIDDVHLVEQAVRLAPGDRLVLYSDGVTDAQSPAGVAFGRERLAAFLCASAHQPAADLCDATFAELAAHQGSAEAYDDATMLVMEVQ